MSENSKIEWTDHTFNPWIGCTKVSPGCANCYAENTTRARVLRGQGQETWGKGKPRSRTSEATWRNPVKWNRLQVCTNCGSSNERGSVVCHAAMCAHFEFRRPRVFPSLCDWLDDEVPIEWLADFLKVIHDTPNLDWLLLTKRPENWRGRIEQARNHLMRLDADAAIWLNDWLPKDATVGKFRPGGQTTTSNPAKPGQPPANIWIGASAEDQKRADERIPELLKIPAKVRFLSVEPMLGPIDLDLVEDGREEETEKSWAKPTERGCGIHWVIFGGESGTGARPCNIEWIRDGVAQCKAAGVAAFVKQLGAKAYGANDGAYNDYDWRKLIHHPKGGEPSEWPEDLRVREFPAIEVGA